MTVRIKLAPGPWDTAPHRVIGVCPTYLVDHPDNSNSGFLAIHHTRIEMTAQGDYAQLPFKASIPVEPFKIQIPDKDLDELKTLLKLSRVSKPTFENQKGNEKLGVSREWLQETKQYWETQYDW